MKLLLYGAVAGLIIGGVAVWKLFPRHEVQIKTETKTVTEYKTRIIERWTKAPDGTETHDRTEESDGTTVIDAKKDKKIAKKHNWNLGLQAGLTTDLNGVKYGIRAERRIIGPVFLGGYITTNKEAGISLGMEF